MSKSYKSRKGNETLARMNKLSAVYAAVGTIEDVCSLIFNSPMVFINGVVAGLLIGEDADDKVLDLNRLTRAEAKTEASLVSKMRHYAHKFQKDFRKAYNVRKKFYDELDKCITTESVGDLIADRSISGMQALRASIRTIAGVASDVDTSINENARQVMATASTSASMCLNKIANLGIFVGTQLQKISKIPSLARVPTALLAIVCTTSVAISKDILMLPVEMAYSIVGGVVEGVGKTVVLGEKLGLNAQSVAAAGALHRKTFNFSGEFSNTKEQILEYIRGFDTVIAEQGLENVFIKDAFAQTRASELVGRNMVLAGCNSAACRAALRISDATRATVRGARVYITSVAAQVGKWAGAKGIESGMRLTRGTASASRSAVKRLQQERENSAPRRI